MLRILIVAMLTATTAWGSVGEITSVTGPGEIKREAEKFQGGVGTDLEMNDAISTKNGAWQLEFIDDTRVDVTEHSRMVIDEFVYDPNTKTGALSMRATLGAVRYASGQIAKNSRQRVNIRTPSATINVRGTDFMMIVDEIGGSMITLLPSCDTTGSCIVGEISVESEVGQVIMNQAFQTTVVPGPYHAPAKPLVLDLPDSMLRAMLIVRRADPYTEKFNKTVPITSLLDIDFLEYDEIDRDPLVESIKNLWLTELDNLTYLAATWKDALDEALRELLAKWLDELSAQSIELFAVREQGMDPDTGIVYFEDPPKFIVERTEQDLHFFRIKLDDGGGYTIDMHQEEFSEYGYRVGVGGTSSITIIQQSQ